MHRYPTVRMPALWFITEPYVGTRIVGGATFRRTDILPVL